MYFCVNIEPKAQSRPRVSTANGYARAYEKADIKKWKIIVATNAVKDMVDHGWIKYPTGTAVAVHVTFILPFPKSYSNKKKAVLQGKPHTQKSDIDNYIKSLLDALSDVCWEDDKQVSSITAVKVWGFNPQMIISIDEDKKPLIL